MDVIQKLSHLKLYANSRTGEDELLLMLLEVSGDKILTRLYPFGYPEGTEVPDRYHLLQVEIAAYLYTKRGAEGQTSHSENGINRTYDDADIPVSLLRGLSPFVGRIE